MSHLSFPYKNTAFEEIVSFHFDRAASLGINELTRAKLVNWLTARFARSFFHYRYSGAPSPFEGIWDEWRYFQVVVFQKEQIYDKPTISSIALGSESIINVWDLLFAEEGLY